MPLVNPSPIVISSAIPLKIGGAPSAGAGLLASAFDHIHPFTETSGPTDLGIGAIVDQDVVKRIGGSLIGRHYQGTRSTGGANTSTVTTPADVDAAQLSFVLKANADYLVWWFVFYTTAATTTGIMLGMNFSAALTSIRYANFGASAATAFQCSVGTTNNASLGQPTVGPGSSERASFLCGFVRTAAAGVLTLRYASGVASSAVNVQPSTHGLAIQT